MVKQQSISSSITLSLAFRALITLISTCLLIQFAVVFNFDGIVQSERTNSRSNSDGTHTRINNIGNAIDNYIDIDIASSKEQPHLFPHLPPLPALALVENADSLAKETLAGNPTIAGIAAILQCFLIALHQLFHKLATEQSTRDPVIHAFADLVKEHLLPLDAPYRGKSVFPIREDDSIFISVASYRDHMMGTTLREAFGKALHPDKLFIGAVVQNCFGIDYTCRTGVEVVGKNDEGEDVTKVSDAPPDLNGIAEFCEDKAYTKYCNSGQVRALYVNETESLGPAMARYYASKLWGGETYYVQIDAHLQFAQHWDHKYIAEIHAAASYPKVVLSSYPPGFGNENKGETPGARLCTCLFGEHQMIRINTGKGYSPGAPAPTQIPFIAAGFFFTRAEFLVDVPFDPLLPWVFMGEEIALSMRAWTSGWNIYAPRVNLISHQYRPGRMGMPKFWETVDRAFDRPDQGFNTKLQKKILQRVKHLVGYPEAERNVIETSGDIVVLTDFEYYSLGNNRTREAFLELTKIDTKETPCKPLLWCNNGDLL